MIADKTDNVEVVDRPLGAGEHRHSLWA